ncbi:hypothetical protein A3C96_00055 [Candidatus Uhrbacteria bacterium RIFCSPHIGHO2_02_FULL_60_10]|uniref:UDP-glucose/GDP-mannose dehydrogenase dimerisation domain-containing protein n=1 Tax=Candidatus Uhrbacteria bacterium RIFCSPHIGHO2_02_FULL_60_10 TaxID=1802392 RepID=A0A1F7U9R3_9BACT|nr:MAG: hypothetical protein A3C96_00055 [Candidatus Uhrbacteria bacterium RIFCSPHIGHO2_02_FULL_60_10]
MTLKPLNKPQIAVMGVGWVGGAMARYFESAGRQPLLYDPAKGLGRPEDLAAADIVFVCVPTPFDKQGGGFDLSYVETAIQSLPGAKTVVIKSTVLPGSTDRLQARWPQHRLLFNPEFLREKTADQDVREPDRQILGVTEQSAAVAEVVMAVLPPAPYTRVMPAKAAELVKYFGNCFLSVKVIFAEQISDLAAKLGVDYDTVRDAAAADPRIGPSHLKVGADGYRGYGGHCFPKDVRALVQLGERLGAEQTLLKTCETINAQLTGGNDHC